MFYLLLGIDHNLLVVKGGREGD